LQVLQPLGAEIAGSQFLEPDGTFPNHIPNPEHPSAMAAAVDMVKASKADLGVVFDTDVDRAAIVDQVRAVWGWSEGWIGGKGAQCSGAECRGERRVMLCVSLHCQAIHFRTHTCVITNTCALHLQDGRPINSNRMIALVAAISLREHPGTTVVTDSVTSDGLTTFIEGLGGKHLRWGGGHQAAGWPVRCAVLFSCAALV
jgi:hypothetical protein